jgi:predicted nucleic acid-binding protein
MTEPRPMVIDVSVAVAIIRNEPDGPVASGIITNRTTDGIRIIVPSHFWLEVTNSLITRRRWAGSKVLEAVHALDALGFETVDLDRPLLFLAIDTSERYGLTAYDAAYLALAISIDGSLMTLDAALRAAAGTRAVHVGPSRLSGTPAVYERPVTWPDYKGASAFLAKLRAEAARPA